MKEESQQKYDKTSSEESEEGRERLRRQTKASRKVVANAGCVRSESEW